MSLYMPETHFILFCHLIIVALHSYSSKTHGEHGPSLPVRVDA